MTILHLIDDTSPGGVTRFLDHLTTAPEFAAMGAHEVRALRRGSLNAPKLYADVIVSHLAVTWRNLPMLTALRALHPDVPLIHVEHSYTEAFVAANAVPPRRFAALMRVAYALFDRVVAVSRPQAQWLERRGYVAWDRLAVVNPVVDLSDLIEMPPVPARAPRTFGLIGRLDTQKGFDIAIEAFRRAAPSHATLQIWGDGAERGALEALAEGDQRIRFMGWAENPAAAFAALDAVLMPSRWEAYGLVALEAQAAGRPVLVSGVDGLGEHTRSGAIRVDGHMVEAWSEAIRTLPEAELGYRIHLGRQQAAVATARCAAGWANLLRNLASEYQDLVRAA